MIEFLQRCLSILLIIKNKLLTYNKIKLSCLINNKTLLGGRNVIHKCVDIRNSKLGYATYIGQNSSLQFTSIGKYCSISSNVSVAIGSHPNNKYVSTHPSFFSTRKQSSFSYVDKDKFNEIKYAKDNYCVCIGNDVWIGSNVTILNGITIGDGAIIGAGAVVTKDVEPYSIVVGVPAKVIKYRFKKNEIDFLLDFRWWNKGESWIKENADLFDDINRFKENNSDE